MHRFIHLGDLHLGPNDRNADRIAALDQAIAENILQPAAAWLMPGDLFHQRSRAEDRNVLKERLKRMANHAPVVLCYGNHDAPGDLDIFADLFAVHPIHVINQPKVIDVHTATGVDAAIFVLPYPQRAGLIVLGVASDNLVDAARGALDLIFMDAAAKLEESRKAGMLTLMIGHVNVAGSIVSSGQPNIGKEIEIDQALLDRLGAIYKGLDHIHKAQAICGAHYAGSLCRLDWGETHQKGYLVIDYDRVSFEHKGGPEVWHHVVTRRPLDVAPMYHVEGTLTREGFDWRIINGEPDRLDYALNQPPDAGWDGCEVRVRYRFAAAERSALNEALVKAPFVGAKRIDTDPIAEHSRAIRAPEVAAAQTLDEKLHAIAKGAGLEWTETLTEKLALLQQAPDGAAFLSAVESRLTVIDAEVQQEVYQ